MGEVDGSSVSTPLLVRYLGEVGCSAEVFDFEDVCAAFGGCAHQLG